MSADTVAPARSVALPPSESSVKSPSGRPRRRDLRTLAAAEWILYPATAIGSLVVTFFALGLRRAQWDVPFYYTGDAVTNIAWLKTISEQGWYEVQPLLSAPFAQQFHDYSDGEHLGFLIAKVLFVFIHDPFVVLNVYFVLGFPLAALSALAFLRFMGVRRVLSIALAILYAIAPYHFQRNEAHLALGSYYPLPLVLVLVVLAMRGQPLFTLRSEGRWWARPFTAQSLFSTVALALLALDATYYTVFAALLLGTALVVSVVRTRRWRTAVGPILGVAVLGVVSVINLAPDYIYAAQNGKDYFAVGRIPNGVEVYALKLAQLVLPIPNSRIPVLAGIREIYDQTFPVTSEDPALGTWGALGLLLLLGVAFLRFIKGREGRTGVRGALSDLALLVVVCLAVASVGGFSTFLSFVTSDLRGWNRISIVILLLSFAAVGLVLGLALDRVPRIMRRPRPRAVTGVAVALVVVLLGYIDQVGTSAAPDYASAQAQFSADASMVQTIEGDFGKRAMILQLPYRAYPESAGATGVPDTDQLKPFLHSSTLRWSGGGVKGRPESDWVASAQTRPVRQLVDGAATAGFSAVLVDTSSYADGGVAEVASLQGRLGAPTFTSEDGRYVCFSLSAARSDALSALSAADRATLATATVNPIEVAVVPDFNVGYTLLDTLKPYRPRILIQNQRKSAARIRIDWTVAFPKGPADVTLSGLGTDRKVTLGPTPRTIQLDVTVPPGQSWIDVSRGVSGPFPRPSDGANPLSWSTLTATEPAAQAVLSRLR